MAQLDWMSEDQRQENTFLVADEHAGLPSNPEVLAAIDELLTAGKIDQRGRARDRVRIELENIFAGELSVSSMV